MELMKMPRARVRKVYFPQAVSSLIDPSFRCILPARQLLWAKPQGDLLLGTLNRITAMNHILANFNAEVSSDGTRPGLSRVGLSDHCACHPDHIQALPHHGHHRPRAHVLHQAAIEGPVLQGDVVLLQQLLRGLQQLQPHQLEALPLEAPHDLPHQVPLDAVRFDGDEGFLEDPGSDIWIEALRSLDCKHSIEPQAIPCSITWRRNMPSILSAPVIHKQLLSHLPTSAQPEQQQATH